MAYNTHEAFLSLLEPVHTRLWRFVLSVTRDEAEAEDLLSETVLVAFERFHTLRDPQAFVSFLFTIATRIHRQYARKNNRTERLDDEYANTLIATTMSPDRAAEIRLIRDALTMLPEKQRETVTLFEVSGFSLEEIREIQGGTLSGVKSRLRRGRKELGVMLGVETAETRPLNFKREIARPILAIHHE